MGLSWLILFLQKERFSELLAAASMGREAACPRTTALPTGHSWPLLRVLALATN